MWEIVRLWLIWWMSWSRSESRLGLFGVGVRYDTSSKIDWIDASCSLFLLSKYWYSTNKKVLNMTLKIVPTHHIKVRKII